LKLIKKPIIFLLGPTASGKTDWAINWQNQFDFLEIISVDSVMVYKECNIGSAKPSNTILKKHPHHLVNHISLDSIFSVADFYGEAMKLIQHIHGIGKIPLMVGGSMMYFNLLKTGMSTLPPADRLLRDELEKKNSYRGSGCSSCRSEQA
jgi:tRNA dimethylallyltransferase